jgi:hypothetical protein
VLWARDYSALPVAKGVEIGVVGDQLVAQAQFVPRGIYEFAGTVYQMLRSGYLSAVSVGFRPLVEPTPNEYGGFAYRRQELLEFSVVPVGAHADALVIGRGLRAPDEVAVRKWLGGARGSEVALNLIDDPNEPVLDIADWTPVIERAAHHAHRRIAGRVAEKGVSPPDVSTRRAPEDAPWSAPALGDFTDERWSDLSDAEKRRIAGHYAYTRTMPPETFGDLSLPHHDPKTGSIVWRGVAAAAARLNQTSIPSADLPAVKAHLRRHYDAFDKPVPDNLKAAGSGDDEPVLQLADDDEPTVDAATAIRAVNALRPALVEAARRSAQVVVVPAIRRLVEAELRRLRGRVD